MSDISKSGCFVETHLVGCCGESAGLKSHMILHGSGIKKVACRVLSPQITKSSNGLSVDFYVALTKLRKHFPKLFLKQVLLEDSSGIQDRLSMPEYLHLKEYGKAIREVKFSVFSEDNQRLLVKLSSDGTLMYNDEWSGTFTQTFLETYEGVFCAR